MVDIKEIFGSTALSRCRTGSTSYDETIVSDGKRYKEVPTSEREVEYIQDDSTSYDETIISNGKRYKEVPTSESDVEDIQDSIDYVDEVEECVCEGGKCDVSGASDVRETVSRQTAWNIDADTDRTNCCMCHHHGKSAPATCPLSSTRPSAQASRSARSNQEPPPTATTASTTAPDRTHANHSGSRSGSNSTEPYYASEKRSSSRSNSDVDSCATVNFCAVKCSSSSNTSNESHCSRTHNENGNENSIHRLKRDGASYHPLDISNSKTTYNTPSGTTHKTQTWYTSCKNRIATRRTMLRILCQGIVVVLLCLCGGVVMYKNNHGASSGGASFKGKVIHKLPSTGIIADDDSEIIDSNMANVVMDLPFKGVHVDDLERHLAASNSITDVLKIFFDQPNLSDHDINSIMWMKSHSTMYGSGGRSVHNKNVMSDRSVHNKNVMSEMEEDHRDEALRHHSEVANSALARCGDPVPELVMVEEAQRTSFKHFYPHCTIMHRCRNTTGCCKRGYTCKPSKNGIRIVEKFFLVFKQTAGNTVVPLAKNFVESRVFVNHTSCECARVHVESNCDKKCPHQFVKERPGADCTCVCKTQNRKCRHMYRGLKPLDEKDLECIKSGNCIEPKCHTGHFKVATGFCPRFRHKHHKQ